MEKNPVELVGILLEKGYDSLHTLPNTKDSLDWKAVQQDCEFSNPSLFKLKNALFPTGYTIQYIIFIHYI